MSASASFASSSLDLSDLGWDGAWSATLATAVQLHGPVEPARVARLDLGACTVLGAAGAVRVSVPPGVTVTVGDWVLARGSAVVGALPRRTAIVRRSAGAEARAQTLAANVGSQCRSADCSHRKEPGCAVRAAVADWRVTEERLASWRKLRRELDRLAAREDPALRDQLRTEQRRLYREYAPARKQWRGKNR